MEQLNLIDHSAISPNVDDLVSDELLGYLNASSNGSYNPTLGTTADPRYPSYKEFLNQIDASVILQLSPEDLSSGHFDELDLTGEENPKDYIIEEKKFYNTNNFDKILDMFTMMYGFTPLSEGLSVGREFAPVPIDSDNWNKLALDRFQIIV